MSDQTQEQLATYVDAELAKGTSVELIYQTLLQKGHAVSDIAAYLARTSSPISAASPATTAAPPITAVNHDAVQKNAINSVLFVAAVLVGVGVFSFIASNWQLMGKALKLVVIIVAMIGAYAGGFILNEKWSLTKTSQALFLLGNLIYGAGIFLIGQMFNIRASWPDGFILWMLGVLLFAYISEITAIYYLVFILGVIATVAHPSLLFAFGQTPYSMTMSTVLLVVSMVATFYVALVARKKAYV